MFDKYRDKWGFTTDKPNRKNIGHGVLFTALEVYAKSKAGIREPDERIKKLLKKAQHPKHKGLIVRSPAKLREQDSHDNAYAFLYLASVYRPYEARLWLKHGYYTWPLSYYYNNRKPGRFELGYMKPWLGRFPHLIATGKVACQFTSKAHRRHKPNRIELLTWKKAQKNALRDYGRNVEAAMLFVFRNEIAKRSTYKEFRNMAAYFDKKFRIKGGLGPALDKYGKHWRVHPIRLLLKEHE